MGNGLSMSSRAEVTSRFPKAYVKAGKKDKGEILDQVIEAAATLARTIRGVLWNLLELKKQISTHCQD